jgi:hypothetical protein
MHAKAPGSVVFEEEEVERINRAQVALLLHKFPSEVDAQPYRDIADVMAIHNANDQIQADKAKKRRKGK